MLTAALVLALGFAPQAEPETPAPAPVLVGLTDERWAVINEALFVAAFAGGVLVAVKL